jgi:hypothetical protein
MPSGIYKPNSYLTGNTLLFGYRDQPDNAVHNSLEHALGLQLLLELVELLLLTDWHLEPGFTALYCVSSIKVKFEIILRPTISRPVCPDTKPPYGNRDQFYFYVNGHYI